MRLNLTPKPRTGVDLVVRKQRIPRLRRLLGIAVWVLLATVLWFMQTLSRGTNTIVYVPIVYEEMPGEIGLEGEQLTTLDVSVSAKGSQLLFRWMKGVPPISLSMPQRVSQGGRILFSSAVLTQKVREILGNSIQIRDIYPNQISLRAFPLQRKEVPVINHVSASAKDGYMVLPLTMTPTTVELYGSREALEGISEVHTKELLYKNLSQDKVMQVPIEEPPHVYSSPDSVQLQISVVELTERRIELPVEALNTPPGFVAKLLPARISLTLTMPITDYNKPIGDKVSVVVDLQQLSEAVQRGEKRPEMLPVRVEGLPDWVVRAATSPKAVQYILETAEP